MNKTGKVVQNLLCIMFALMGACGTVLSFASCFSFEKGNMFYIIPIVLTVLVCGGFLVDKIFAIELPTVLVLFVGFVLLKIKDIVGSFVTTANVVINDVNRSYQMGFNRIAYPEFARDYDKIELALIVFSVLVALLISFFVMGRANVVGAMLSSVPFVVFGIFFDLFPKLSFLVMAAMFWIVSVVFHIAGHKGRMRPRAAMYNGAFVVMLVLLAVTISQIFMPESEYDKTKTAKDIKVKLNEGMKKAQEAVNTLTQSEIFKVEMPAINGFGSIGQGGGVGYATFGNKDNITFTGEKVLEVTVPYLNENIYLRAATYNEYEGNGWGNDNRAFLTEFNLESITGTENWATNLSGSIVANIRNGLHTFYGVGGLKYFELTHNYNAKIDVIAERGYAFAPYGAYIDGTWEIKADEMPQIRNLDANGRTFTFSIAAAQNVAEFQDIFDHRQFIDYVESHHDGQNANDDVMKLYNLLLLEQDYSKFVKEAYTEVPTDIEDTIDRFVLDYIYNELKTSSVMPNDYQSAMRLAEVIRDIFSSQYSYTLSPGKVPLGEDGIEYFLNENKKGYCVYFASAATMIFRAAGIPARYVEGYVVTPAMASINKRNASELIWYMTDEAFHQNIDYVTVTVPDNKAHAWPEIYIDGYGWIPVEVTPGYSVTGQVATESANQEEETTTIEEETTTRTEESVAHAKTDKNDEEIAWEKFFKSVLTVCIIIAVAAVLFFGANAWYQSGLKRIGLIIKGGAISGKKRAALCWWYINALMKAQGKPIPENISYEAKKMFLSDNTEFFSENDFNGTIDYIIKAYYGNEELTNEELTSIGKMAADFREATYEELPGMQQIWLKYFMRL